MVGYSKRRLRCVGIEKRHVGVRALDSVSIAFPDTGIVGLIGPNGAGKTTLINVLTGFTSLDRGRVYLHDRDVTGGTPYNIARMGLARTFQDVRLARRVSTLDNVLGAMPGQTAENPLVALGAFKWRRGDLSRRARASELLELVGLGGLCNRIAGSLSYGQQKLLSLALCVASGARVLLLDEPVAGTDARARRKIVGLLNRLAREDRLVVVIEHDLHMIETTARWVVALESGRVLAEGNPHDVFKSISVRRSYIG